MGSAQYADVKKVNKRLADLSKDPDDEKNIVVLKKRWKEGKADVMAGMSRAQIVNTRNRILSQNIQMTLDTRHTDLNNNILVIGGSGSGKNISFCKAAVNADVQFFLLLQIPRVNCTEILQVF